MGMGCQFIMDPYRVLPEVGRVECLVWERVGGTSEAVQVDIARVPHPEHRIGALALYPVDVDM